MKSETSDTPAPSKSIMATQFSICPGISKYFKISTDNLLKGNILKKSIEIILLVLFILNLFSIWIGLGAEMLTPQTENLYSFNEETGVFTGIYFVIVIGISVISLLAGICYKSKGYKCKKNIVTAIIFILFTLPVYFSFLTVEKGFYRSNSIIIDGKEYLENIAEKIDFEIPTQNAEILCNIEEDIDKDAFLTDYKLIYKFNSKDYAKAFEKTVIESNKWKCDLNSFEYQFIFLATKHFTDPFEYFMIYDSTSNTYNKLPNEEGKHEFYILEFDTDEGIINIYNVTVDYVENFL